MVDLVQVENISEIRPLIADEFHVSEFIPRTESIQRAGIGENKSIPVSFAFRVNPTLKPIAAGLALSLTNS